MYMPVWGIPAVYILLKYKRENITIYREKKYNRNKVLKQLKIRTIMGSIVFSVLVFGESVYVNGQVKLTGIFWVLYGAVAFGVLFYLAMRFVVVSDKKEENMQ